MGSNPTEVKSSLIHGDSQISVKGVVPNGDLVYRQYSLLLAPKHILKNHGIYLPAAQSKMAANKSFREKMMS